MTPRQIIAAIGVVAVTLGAGLMIAQGPLYERYSAEECARAYGRAASRGDTARVDLHPYAPATGRIANERCGQVRARLVASEADILPRAEPGR